MRRWALIVLLFVGAHFGASYLVPLSEDDRGAFGGLLRCMWPWSVGDRGFLGVQDGLQVPMPGFWIVMAAAGALMAAASALLGWLVPTGWWRALTTVAPSRTTWSMPPISCVGTSIRGRPGMSGGFRTSARYQWVIDRMAFGCGQALRYASRSLSENVTGRELVVSALAGGVDEADHVGRQFG